MEFERANDNQSGQINYENLSPWSVESNGEDFVSFGVV